ncbi:MAG TPA: hypothetical protein VNO23_00540 [Candidatus Binatia bacterium]|jgi:hypothetical protein|nr:hypothetical protein [Candidatus Binatia bacterium]
MEQARSLPPSVTTAEARVLLRLLARLKERRFGRLAVDVRDRRLVGVEIVEKLDRNLFRTLS